MRYYVLNTAIFGHILSWILPAAAYLAKYEAEPTKKSILEHVNLDALRGCIVNK